MRKHYILPGNYCKSNADRIVEALAGKTFMRFEVTCGNHAGNITITVYTEYDCEQKDFEDMVIFAAMNAI